MKNWKEFEDECNVCGSIDIRVLTDANNGYAYDGDDAECITCGLKGSVCVDDEDNNGNPKAHVSWNDCD